MVSTLSIDPDTLIEAAAIAASGQIGRPDGCSQRERQIFVQRVMQFLLSLQSLGHGGCPDFDNEVYSHFFQLVHDVGKQEVDLEQLVDPAAFVAQIRDWLTSTPMEQIEAVDREMLPDDSGCDNQGPCRLLRDLLDQTANAEPRPERYEETVHAVVQEILTCLGRVASGHALPDQDLLFGLLGITLKCCAELEVSDLQERCVAGFAEHLKSKILDIIDCCPETTWRLEAVLQMLEQGETSLAAQLGEQISAGIIDFLSDCIQDLLQDLQDPDSNDGSYQSNPSLASFCTIFFKALDMIFLVDVNEGIRFCEYELEGRLIYLLGEILSMRADRPLDPALKELDDTLAWMHESCLEERKQQQPLSHPDPWYSSFTKLNLNQEYSASSWGQPPLARLAPMPDAIPDVSMVAATAA